MSLKITSALLTALLVTGLSGTAQAQSAFEPNGTSARQVSDPESPTVESETLITRSGFQLLGHQFFWGRAVWMPGSSFAMPALFMLPGDRRWGIR